MTGVQNADRMYRHPTKPPVTAWARHLDQVMRDRAWSQTQFFEAVGPAMGYSPKSRSAVLGLLIDKEPNAAQARVLRELFGEPAEAPVAEPTPSRDDLLAAAIDRQTAAMEAQATAFTRLAESIDRAASGVVGTVSGFDDLLRGLLVALGPQGPAAPADDAPRLAGGSPRTPATGTGR